jgi:hypothetical protein
VDRDVGTTMAAARESKGGADVTVKVLNVDPNALVNAGKGINGVISDLAGEAGPAGAYTGGTGRGFSGVDLTGGQVGHPGAKAALDNFTDRWEWGTRALVQKANDIAVGLDMSGVGFYNHEREYLNNAAKGWANDVAGDPSLQQAQIDKMSWGQLEQYNENRLLHPDYSARSFEQVAPDIEQNLKKSAANSIDAAVGAVDPAHMTQSLAPVVQHVTGAHFDPGQQLVEAATGAPIEPPPVPPKPAPSH